VLRGTCVDHGCVVEARLPEGAVAYFDGEWLPRAGSAPIHPLIVEDGRRLCFGGERVELPDGMDSDDAAALALSALATDAARLALSASPGGGIEITGEGAVARHARDLVGLPPADGAPLAIVETTGDEAAIVSATERLADLGLLVLAGEPSDRRFSINLYPHVHGRGLRLVGVGPALSNGFAETLRGVEASVPQAFERALAALRPGALVEGRVGWYCVSADH
jgi:hypothetical protein